MSYFVFYQYVNDSPGHYDSYLDSCIYEGKIETQDDLKSVKDFIRKNYKRKGRLVILRITELSRR